MTIEIKVPTLGESITEATVAKWLKQEGESFFKLVEEVRILSKANISNKNKINSFKNLSNKIKWRNYECIKSKGNEIRS